MARSYGRFTTSIYRDKDFRALTLAQQGAYFMLGLQAEVSAAGTLSLTLRRWSRLASDQTADSFGAVLAEVQKLEHVLIDEDTDELLIVKFVKWDGGYTNSKRLPVVREAALAIESSTLRYALAVEMHKLGLVDIASELVPDALSDRASDAVSPSDRVVVTEGELVVPTHNPQSATLEPVAERPAQKRGTRLPDDWRPCDATRTWTLERISSTEAAVELEKFRNHWIAKTGKDATKLDWDRTWRNWVLNAHGRAPSRGRPQQETDDLFDRAARRMGVAT